MFKHLLFLCATCSCAVSAQSQPMNDPFASALSASETAAAAPEGTTNAYPDFQDFAKTYTSFSVAMVTVEELAQEIRDQKTVFVLDARSKEEYEMSKIPGARRVGFEDFTVERVWMYQRNASIVVYCTNGERSEKVAEYLELMGFSNIRHLRSGAVDWLNNGHDLWDKDQAPTKNIHIWKKELLPTLKKGKGLLE